jgi:hypothetical protein
MNGRMGSISDLPGIRGVDLIAPSCGKREFAAVVSMARAN